MPGKSPEHHPAPGPSPYFKAGLSAFLALFAAGPFLPAPMLWGLNHATWLPPAVWPVFPLAGTALVWTPAGKIFGTWLTGKFSPALFSRDWLLYGLVPMLGLGAFWILREGTHMLGDGQTLAVMIAGDNLFHGFDFMTYHLLARLYQATGGGGEAAAFKVAAVVSSVAGAAFLAAAGWASRRLSDLPGPRLLLYVLLVGATSLLLFFGYMEVYAPLSVALLLFVTNFILYRENRGSLTAVAVTWSCGLFFHLNALFLAPLLVLALVRRPAPGGPGIGRRLATLAWPPLAGLLLAGVILASAGYDPARMKEDFGHVGQGSNILVAMTGPDGFFTWRHLKDFVNLLLLLAPLPLLLIFTNLKAQPGKDVHPGLKTDLLLTCGWLLLLMSLIHLKLGAVRDWDLFAPHAWLLVLTGWYLTVRSRRDDPVPGALAGPITAIAVVLLLPWLMVNLDSDKALARLEETSADMSPYALGLLHEQFAYHHQLTGDSVESTRHYRRCGEVCPNHPRFHAIYGTHLLNEGQLAEAAAAYDRSVAADSTYVYGLKMGVVARVMNADYSGALESARILESRGQEDAEAAAAHGMAAQQLGLREEAELSYLRGYALDPDRIDLLERAAGLQLMGRKYALAEEGFRKVLAARPDYGQAALGLADAIWQDYKAGGQDRSPAENSARLAETAGLIDKVLTLDQSDPVRVVSLKTWAAEVRAARVELAGE